MSDSELENSKYSNCIDFSGKMSFSSSILLFKIENFCISFANDWNKDSNCGVWGPLFKKNVLVFALKGLVSNGLQDIRSSSLIFNWLAWLLSVKWSGNDLN